MENTISVSLLSYLLGSIPFGLLLGFFKQKDIRKLGSKNIGATNVYRSFGLMPAIITVLLDGAKGVILPLIFLNEWSMETRLVSLFSAFCGHIFSIFLLFKGGKGVSTFFISTIVIDPKITAIFATIWISTLFLSRYASLASIISFLACTTYLTIMATLHTDRKTVSIAIYSISATLVTLYKHKSNIANLVRKQEHKIDRI